MKTRSSKFLLIGFIFLSISSFLYLNTYGVAATEASLGFFPDTLLEELPDAKITKLILQHATDFFCNL